MKQLTSFQQFERILTHVSKALAARDWETPARQVLDELADEFNRRLHKTVDNNVAAMLSFGS